MVRLRIVALIVVQAWLSLALNIASIKCIALASASTLIKTVNAHVKDRTGFSTLRPGCTRSTISTVEVPLLYHNLRCSGVDSEGESILWLLCSQSGHQTTILVGNKKQLLCTQDNCWSFLGLSIW